MLWVIKANRVPVALCSHYVRVNFDQDGIIDAIPLPVKRSALVDCALCCTHLHAIGNLDNRCAREQLLDATDRIDGSFTQSWNPMIYVIKLSKPQKHQLPSTSRPTASRERVKPPRSESNRAKVRAKAVVAMGILQR